MFQRAEHHKAWIPRLLDQWPERKTGSVPCLNKIRTNEFHIVKVILQIVWAFLLYIEKTAEFRKHY